MGMSISLHSAMLHELAAEDAALEREAARALVAAAGLPHIEAVIAVAASVPDGENALI